MGLELSSAQLYIASGASLLLALYALTLPKIPVAEKKANTTLASKLGLDAFVLFKTADGNLLFVCDDAGGGVANHQRLWQSVPA